jgi:glycosyltransferase involved in cell wall biosynthesis
VSRRLLAEFGEAVRPAALLQPDSGLAKAAAKLQLGQEDWWFTGELFCEAEFPGMWDFVRERRCRKAAIFYDAIPLKFPHITWPQSVGRHPEYMKMLASFDRVFAISEASREELLGFWRWQGVEVRAKVETIVLGADFSAQPRETKASSTERAGLLSVGILEPRKNQSFLMDVCENLWRDGLKFDLHLVGRVNPHFGQPVLAKVKALKKRWPGLYYHEAATDETMAALYRKVRVNVSPTLAEGCGLPLLESLWQGVPCVCSDLPVLRENADAGGCLPVAPNRLEEWSEALRRVLSDDAYYAELMRQATSRALPTWSETAKTLLSRLS